MIQKILIHWLRLSRPAWVAGAVSAWAVIASLGVVAVRHHDEEMPIAAGPVYPIATVLAGIRQQPSAWIGRTLVIRGFFETACCSGSMPNPGFPDNGLFDGPSDVLIPAPPSLSLQGETRRLPLAPNEWVTTRVTLRWQARCYGEDGGYLGLHGCAVGRLDT